MRIEQASRAELTRAWPRKGARERLRRTFPDGRLVMVVERDDDVGYSVRAPRFGWHLVSSDGSSIRSWLPGVAAWRWERLLYAQVLPLASALRGRQLLHASAVSLNGRVLAFVGTSGAGKSTVAAHLVDRGATLVTDDVLALDLADGHVRAHPGTRLVGLDPRELEAMRSGAFARLGQAEKAYLDVEVTNGAEPLGAVYVLGIGSVASVEITPSTTPAALLGAGFLGYLDDPDQLVRHLEVCSAIARVIPTFEVVAPRAGDAARVAAAIRDHAGRSEP